MTLTPTGAGSERAGPFSLLEPLGLLWGRDAALAQAHGSALPLNGGPGVFTLVRHGDEVVSATEAMRLWPGGMAPILAPLAAWAGFGAYPLVMGILNATPDSFSDGGDRYSMASAVAAGRLMLDQGADILDIGGESTRPGAVRVPAEIEQARILPVIEALAGQGAVISVDTRNAATMRLALAAGARVVNDVSALTWDPAAAGVVAAAGCPVILMHMRGTPVTMTSRATYADVAAEVMAELSTQVSAAERAGIDRAQIAIDPGFGFAKNAEQNLALMQRLPTLCGLGLPILAGISRKSTIGMLTGEPVARQRDAGSVAAGLFCLSRGARLLRVHDVAGTRQAVSVWSGLNR